MKRYTRLALAVALTLALIVSGLIAMTSANSFEIFDGSRLDFPDEFTTLGMRQMCVLYPSQVYRDKSKSRRALPAEKNIRAAARDAARDCTHAVIDIESWMPKMNKAGRLMNQKFRNNYVKLARIWKEENSTTKLGFYNMPRRADNYKALRKNMSAADDYLELQRSFMEPLKGMVDFAVTSAYWKYDDQKRNIEWWRLAMEATDAAWGKDVPHYFFVWWRGVGPQHRNTAAGGKGHAWIDISRWKFMMDWMQQNADGVILWSRKDEEQPDEMRGTPIRGGQPYKNWSTAKMLREQQAADYGLSVPEALWIRDLRDRLRDNR